MGQKCGGCLTAENARQDINLASHSGGDGDEIDPREQGIGNDEHFRAGKKKKMMADNEMDGADMFDLSQTNKKDIHLSIHAPKASSATLIDKFPDIANSQVLAAYKKNGPFKFTVQQLPEDENLPVLGPYQIENDIVYIGQWKNGVRHGKGKQLWKDGSLYEGKELKRIQLIRLNKRRALR